MSVPRHISLPLGTFRFSRARFDCPRTSRAARHVSLHPGTFRFVQARVASPSHVSRHPGTFRSTQARVGPPGHILFHQCTFLFNQAPLHPGTCRSTQARVFPPEHNSVHPGTCRSVRARAVHNIQPFQALTIWNLWRCVRVASSGFSQIAMFVRLGACSSVWEHWPLSLILSFSCLFCVVPMCCVDPLFASCLFL